MMKLYRWQEKALQNWKNNGCRGIVDAVTGAGKTALAVAAVKYLREMRPNLRVKIVAPTIPLAGQWRQIMLCEAENGDEIPGFFGGGQKDRADRSVMVYVVNSARNDLSRHIRSDLAMGRSVLVIFDECHHYQSRENSRIFDFRADNHSLTENCFTLGLSATPFKDDGDDRILLSGIGPPVYRYGLSEAVRDGVVSPFFICHVTLDFTPAEAEEYAELSTTIAVAAARLRGRYPELRNCTGASFFQAVSALAAKAENDSGDLPAAYLNLIYLRKELSVSAAARIKCCADLIERLHARDRIIIFCERIPQAEQTAQLLRRRFGDVCGVYHSQQTKSGRARVLEAFRNGESRILVTCRALDEGIDVPDAGVGIVLSCSSVRRQRIQRIGRLLRKAEGKNAACLYYFYVRNSNDEPVFLRDVQNAGTIALQYDAAEHAFSDAYYEYMARELLAQAQERRLAPEAIREMRRCLLEGIGRADYLTDADTQAEKRRAARTRHTKNYWLMMNQMRLLTEGDLNNGL